MYARATMYTCTRFHLTSQCQLHILTVFFYIYEGYTSATFVFTTISDTFYILFYNIILSVILLQVSRILNELFIPVSLLQSACKRGNFFFTPKYRLVCELSIVHVDFRKLTTC